MLMFPDITMWDEEDRDEKRVFMFAGFSSAVKNREKEELTEK